MKDTLFTILSLYYTSAYFDAEIIPGTINYDSSSHDPNSEVTGYTVRFTGKLNATDEICYQSSYVITNEVHASLVAQIGVMTIRETFVYDHAAAQVIHNYITILLQ